MTRSKNSVNSRKRRKNIIKLSKGYYGARSRSFKVSKQSTIKAGQYAYRDRRCKKRNIRKLWILKINAAVRKFNITYSKFIYKLKQKSILIDRKIICKNIINNEKYISELISYINS